MPLDEPDALSPERLAGALRSFTEATTLPAEAYTDPAVYSRECERLFLRSWLCAGRVDQVPSPGDYRCLDLLGDKLVLVHGHDGRIRVLSRICRHRGASLVEGAGHTRSFSCPYHAWTYGLDGRLVGAPHMEGAAGFDRADCGLPELRSEVWEGWIFVSFDPDAAPLGPELAPLSRALAPYRLSELVAVETATFASPFNWKVLVDNFMEAYHHIAIHRDTLEPLFPAIRSHTPDNDGPYSMLVMPGAPEPEEGGAASPLPTVGPLSQEERHQLIAAVVYPFHLFAPGAEFVTWYQLLPERLDHFSLRVFSCFPREVAEDDRFAEAVEGVKAITQAVHVQDIAACEATWAGLGARSYSAGRLAPLEKPLWQFNRWWIEQMTGAS